jgi:hypothetical protein
MTEDAKTEQERLGGLRGLLDFKAIINGAIGSALVAAAGIVWKVVSLLFGSFPGLPWRAIAVGAVAALWLGVELALAVAWRHPASEPIRPNRPRHGPVRFIADWLVLVIIFGGSAATWVVCWVWPIEYGLLLAGAFIFGMACFCMTVVEDRRLLVLLTAGILAVVSGMPAAAPVVAHLAGWQSGVLVTLLPVEILLIGYLLLSITLLAYSIVEKFSPHKS